jgi:hypothetical protein
LGQQFVVPESRNTPTVPQQVSCPVLVIARLSGVLAAIQLDDDAMLETGKIHMEWSNRMLPPKLASTKAAFAQVPPQKTFCIRLLSTNFAS